MDFVIWMRNSYTPHKTDYQHLRYELMNDVRSAAIISRVHLADLTRLLGHKARIADGMWMAYRSAMRRDKRRE